MQPLADVWQQRYHGSAREAFRHLLYSLLVLERRLLEKANTEPSSSELRSDLMPDSIACTCNTNATKSGAVSSRIWCV